MKQKRKYMVPTIAVCGMYSEPLLLDGSSVPVTPGGDDREDAGGAMSVTNDSQWDLWEDENREQQDL